MSDDDNKEPDKIAKITFIVRKDAEQSPEEQEHLRKRLEELFKIYVHGKMDQDISGIEPRNKHPVRRRKRLLIPPYHTIPCDASNREPDEE